MSATIFCTRGHLNPTHAKFCSVCGWPLREQNRNSVDSVPSLPAGVRLRDRYVIQRQLGQGGFGRIYLVEDSGRFNELFVIKEFLPSVRGTATLQRNVELFQQEARILYQLQHPQIPEFREIFQEGDRLFLVQDFIEGQTYIALLEERLRSRSSFGEAEIIKLFQDLLPVLHYLHGSGIIHRDISPDNIILNAKTGLPVLIDLGAAKQAVINATIADFPDFHKGASIGKTGYAPDEQVQSGTVAPCSDLYALAVTGLVLMTGKQPQDLLDQHTLQWQWEREITLNSHMTQVLNRMLAPRPDQRYQSADEVIQELTVFTFPDKDIPVASPPPANFSSPNLLPASVSVPPTAPFPLPNSSSSAVSITNHNNATSTNTPQQVLRKIQKAKESQLRELKLSNEELKEIPIEVFELEWLESLDLSSNNLTSISHHICQLQNLKTLDLSRNELLELPDNVTSIKGLTSLYLSLNDIIETPESIANLENLIRLDLSDNLLTSESCHSLRHLKNLAFLYLSHNHFTELPESICHLYGLTSLNLDYNHLSRLPKKFVNLRNLNELSLTCNDFEEIPEPVYELPFLNSLSVANYVITMIGRETNLEQIEKMATKYKAIYNPSTSYNQIREVPPLILKLGKLRTFVAHGNPISEPPYEVTQKGIEEIKQYYRQLEIKGKDYIYEAKLLIVGEGGAGKTTLVKKIQTPGYQLQEEDSTQGIEVVKWNLTLSNERVFRVNIWDFGGQEIYHATHQFFLTKRSLYILVADTRREDTDFYYWLNTVRLFSENSPLIIIKNERQDRQREIPENQLRGQFSNFKETIAINLATNRGLLDVFRGIEHYITTLPHVGTALPKTWVSVREALENDLRNYLSLEEYLNICRQHGFAQLEDKLQLSGYLHDLGIVLHFQDDPILKNIIILKPSWGTDAVYKILDNDQVKQSFGHFSWSDLISIWRDEKYANKQVELLQLMCKFKLCYEIPGQSGFYIAPQLLTENQPEYEWDEINNLMLRYTYEFMPKRLFVNMSKAFQNGSFPLGYFAGLLILA